MSIINWSTVFKPKLGVMCIEVARHMSILYYWSKFSSQKKLERCLKDDNVVWNLVRFSRNWMISLKIDDQDMLQYFYTISLNQLNRNRVTSRCCLKEYVERYWHWCNFSVEVWSCDPYVGIIIGPYQRCLLYGWFCWENANTNSWKKSL